jgi:hypothetical protein
LAASPVAASSVRSTIGSGLKVMPFRLEDELKARGPTT